MGINTMIVLGIFEKNKVEFFFITLFLNYHTFLVYLFNYGESYESTYIT